MCEREIESAGVYVCVKVCKCVFISVFQFSCVAFQFDESLTFPFFQKCYLNQFYDLLFGLSSIIKGYNVSLKTE